MHPLALTSPLTRSLTRPLALLGTGTALLWALPAAAQISAEDVMANTTVLYEAFGAEHASTLDRQGSVVTVTGDTVTWDIPMGLGQLRAHLSDYQLRENTDGTVNVLYPAGFSVRFEAVIYGEAEASIVMETGPDAITSTASGTPGAISYSTQTGAVSVRMYDARVSDMPDIAVDVTFTAENSQTLTRVLDDSLTVVFSESTIGPAVSRISVTGPDGFTTLTEGRIGASTSSLNMGLIPGGADLLNLSAALRDGMYIIAASTSQGSESEAENYVSDSLLDRQSTSAGASEARLTFDSSGFGVSAQGSDILFNIDQPDMVPSRIGFDLRQVSVDMKLPLLAAPEAQSFAYGVGLDGLRLGPAIWGLFDPDKELDRSPADLALRIDGSLINKVDWLDVLALDGLTFDNELPVDVTSVSISELTLGALGARIEGQGAFTFDAGDTETYTGLPRPTGEASLRGSGVNGALDALGEIGVIPPDLLFGMRMGLGMVTVPGSAADVLRSQIELTQDGQIIANGQRLR